MATLDEKKIRTRIIEKIEVIEFMINKTEEEEDDVMMAFLMGGQTELLKILIALNDI